MRNKVLITGLGLGLLVSSALNVAFFTFSKPDSIWRVLNEVIGSPGTVFSPSFTEKKFESIIFGMTEEQVLLELGNPLKRVDLPCSKQSFLHFSLQKGAQDDFQLRIITLVDGKVIRVEKDIYLE